MCNSDVRSLDTSVMYARRCMELHMINTHQQRATFSPPHLLLRTGRPLVVMISVEYVE